MDLAKVGEVWSSYHTDKVNERLAEGWVLLTVKVGDQGVVTYVLGKPREKPKPEARSDSHGPRGCYDDGGCGS